MAGTRYRAALLAAALLLAGCGSAAPTPTPAGPVPAGPTATAGSTTAAGPTGSPTASTPGRPDHVVVVIFENKSSAEVVGHAPTFDALGAQGTRFTRSYGIGHPSQPNYLALFSGSTQGITDDSCPHTFTTPNLAAQLAASGLTFAAYSEGLPQPGYAGCRTGRYARKHAPWTNFAGLPASVAQPFTAFPTDYAALPAVAFVVPDLCDDMHDCPVRTGDDWLAAHLGGYAAWARTHHSVLIVTFDEDDGQGANVIPTIAVGEGVPVGRDDTVVDQYSVLRTIEACFGLPGIGTAAQRAPLAGVCG